ncbi:spermidine/putrescine transport system permease protein [Dongia mobilis]|uniref:Spermidine/putrescine transport system permease protein n=1 Tax=Dongia mobilis TaxID=578943 RepID=A0A4R6WWB0_9PROT|nr:ABC transporter permease [Dongia mobilis]TDQ83332.1 spermidine/putrescine transport system permease protein [Dongia mobilis]
MNRLSSRVILRSFILLYLVAFFAYLFLPLLYMSAAAFNQSRFPATVPWQGFTLEWFDALLNDSMLWSSLGNSLLVGAGVVALSVPIGLNAALLLHLLQKRVRTLAYGVMVSPILMPGVILGISTLVFWRGFDVGGGWHLAVLAQTTFIASYCMMMFQARLQRLDPTWEEAALDLGASHFQVMRRIMLPFLAPTAIGAAVIAFLQSFENYNTTLFVYGSDRTLTIYLAGKVRVGLTPAVNALSVIFILLTVAAAVLFEWRRRAEARPAARPVPAKASLGRAAPVPAE